MKIIIAILLASCLTASAKGISQTITLQVKDASLSSVLQEIKQQSGYSFVFARDLHEKAKKVTLQVENQKIDFVLSAIFSAQPFTYKIINTVIIINTKDVITNQTLDEKLPFLDISGRVINENGEPMAGVTVTVKGTKTATATNGNGEFSLTGIDKDARLVFTSVNAETYELSVNDKSDIGTVVLKTKATSLDEVNITVSTGYQSISKERSTGSFAKPDMAIMQNRSTSMNVLQRLVY